MDEAVTRRERLVRWGKRLGAATIAGLLLLWLAILAIPLPERLGARDSVLVLYQDGRPAHVFLSPDDRWRIGRPGREVDPDFVRALLALEDQRFWTHVGVDPIAIGRAAISNLTRGRVVSGASTLTMQLARMLEPRPRTLRSKVIEAFRALQLEWYLDKHEILTQYLRFAPYGRNIEGVDAAALTYFGHRADALTPAEIVTLLAVPQAPNRRYPSVRHQDALTKARAKLTAKLLEVGALPRGDGDAEISPAQLSELILAQPVPVMLEPFPRELPHAAPWLKRRHKSKDILPTTIDRGVQRVAERVMASRREGLTSKKIHNGAVVVLDHASGEVRALVGNFDFGDDEHGGQIPGFDVARSTGSLIKPTIAAMGIDRGLVHPEMMVPDVPRTRAGWRPRNFDGTYSGLVTVGSALVRSLNVPFVDLVEQVGVADLLEMLRRAELEHLVERAGHYGLSIAIGGVEATPVEVAGLYAALANLGAWRAPRMLKTTPTTEPTRLHSPGASWLIQEVLRSRERPDLAWRKRRTNEDGWSIHWKTGTSNGNRDAWSAGSGAMYTAVVWLGNFDNASSEALVGARAAAPVMFDLLEALEPRHQAKPPAPDDLKTVSVCSFTGYISAPCEKRRDVLVPVHGVPMQPSPYHRTVEVDVATGLAVTPACRAGRTTRTKTLLAWPTRIARHLEARALALAEVPKWAPGCAPPEVGEAPKITSPTARQRVMLIPGVPPERQNVPLMADAGASRELTWFVNGELLATASPHERVWWTPSPGVHEIMVMNEAGQMTSSELEVMAKRR